MPLQFAHINIKIGPLSWRVHHFFFNFIVSTEEMAPDKFLAFGLVLGFNFSARRLQTSSSAFSRSACELKNDELRFELVIKDGIRGWTNMCGFKFSLNGYFISADTSALVCSQKATSFLMVMGVTRECAEEITIIIIISFILNNYQSYGILE